MCIFQYPDRQCADDGHASKQPCHALRMFFVASLGTPLAAAIFLTGVAAIYINYASDHQRQEFRRRNGDITVWCGKKPEYIEGG